MNFSPDTLVSESHSNQILSQDFLSRLEASATHICVIQLLLCSTFVFLAHDSAPSKLVYSCAIVWLALSLFRFYYYGFSLKKTGRPIIRKRRNLLMLNFLLGSVLSASIALFPYLAFAERTFFTILISASISRWVTNFGYKEMFVYLAAPPMITLSIVWCILPIPDCPMWVQFAMAALMLSYLGVLIADSQSFFTLFKETYEIRAKQKETNSKLNEALSQARSASESKTRFLASASHDLRQPIHTLSLLSAAMTMQDLNPQATKVADHLESAINGLAKQMDGLLDISKLDAGLVRKSITIFDLVPMLLRFRDEYSIACEAKGLKIEYLCEHEFAMVETDRELLRRVIRNLLSNAVRYTDKGEIAIELLCSGDKWQLSVRDTGRGVEPAMHQRVFEEFYQVGNSQRDKQHGLGLGLAIVKRLSDILNLEVSLQSELGVGSDFVIRVDASDQSLSNLYKDSYVRSESVTELPALRILCIDDETHIRDAMVMLLSELGCLVDVAQSSEEALDVAMRAQPDVVLADLRLAGEDSGIIAIQKIRAVYPELSALLVSGDTAPERMIQAEEAGIEMLHKPVEIQTLRMALSRVDKLAPA